MRAPVVVRLVDVLSRQQIERQNSMFDIWFFAIWSVSHPTNHQLTNVRPRDIWVIVVYDGHRKAALNALVQLECAGARNTFRMVHVAWCVPDKHVHNTRR